MIAAKQAGAKSLMESERKRVASSVTLTAPEWKEIDHWATARGIGDRLEAIRQLLALGLKASAEEQQAVEESAASMLASEEGLRASKRKGKV